MPNHDAEFRRRMMDRANTLRVAAGMSQDGFFATAGPAAANSRTRFVIADENDAWEKLSIYTLDRIAWAFDIGGGRLVANQALTHTIKGYQPDLSVIVDGCSSNPTRITRR